MKSIKDRAIAVCHIKRMFEDEFCRVMNTFMVPCPMIVRSDIGINDDLNGIEKPVSFKATGMDVPLEVVQSLAKWKRVALGQYGFVAGEGIITNMHAIRPDEAPDSIHSHFVDQWDWEKVLQRHDRTSEFLRRSVSSIYSVIREVERKMSVFYPELQPILPEQIHFVTAEEALKEYPDMAPREREHALCKKYGAIFLQGIGGRLSDESIHDGRAPDYDDWLHELNGDIILHHPTMDKSIEISSMGIRVDEQALEEQLAIRECSDRKALPFHRDILEGKIPLSIGGGIGQSRLCMLLMRCTHISEVQCSPAPRSRGMGDTSTARTTQTKCSMHTPSIVIHTH
jgi:aspartate--ammonia ligase